MWCLIKAHIDYECYCNHNSLVKPWGALGEFNISLSQCTHQMLIFTHEWAIRYSFKSTFKFKDSFMESLHTVTLMLMVNSYITGNASTQQELCDKTTCITDRAIMIIIGPTIDGEADFITATAYSPNCCYKVLNFTGVLPPVLPPHRGDNKRPHKHLQ